MTTEVLTTSAERSVAEVTSMMVKARVGSAVVMGGFLAGRHPDRAGCAAGGRLGFGSDQVAGFGVDDEEPNNGHVRHDSRGGRRGDASQWVSPSPGGGGPRAQGRGQYP